MSRDIEIVRETDDAIWYTDEWKRKHNSLREVRKQAGHKLDSWDRKLQPTKAIKYPFVGGPLHGKKYAHIQLADLGPDGEGYVEYNKSGYLPGQYSKLLPKMIRIHITLLETPNGPF